MSRSTLHRFVASACALLLGLLIAPSAFAQTATLPGTATLPPVDIHLEVIGIYETGLFDEGAAEIVTFDPETARAYVSNAFNANIDVLDLSDPSAPELLFTIDIEGYGASVNSVSFHDGVLAAAIQAEEVDANGAIVFFDADGTYLSWVEAGVLPDMITFSPDGHYVLTANEGEPNDDYTIDPEGSVTIVDVSGGVEGLAEDAGVQVSFAAFNDAPIDPDIRIFGPNATVAQDLEPEYIAVSPDSTTAYVSLQENNALAIVDIAAGEAITLAALGFKDHSRPMATTLAQGALRTAYLDASNEDGGIHILPWPVLGMYMPDSIAAYEADGETYLITANEGDARDYDGYSEEARVADLELNPAIFPDAESLQAEENLGRLNSTTANGDLDGDGLVDTIFAYGARSFSIWDSAGTLVFDSGDDFEHITAEMYPTIFNSNGAVDTFDDRSDDKGPEPEAVTVGVIDDRTFAFIGLERIGGVMVYDVTVPTAPIFVEYVNNVNLDAETEEEAGDSAPEGFQFVPAEDSPIGEPLLIVANEVSGTTTIYAISTMME